MTTEGTRRPGRDPLYRLIIGTAIFLVVTLALLVLLGEPQARLVAVPSFVVVTHGFIILASFCIAFMALGRNRVLGDRLSHWTGVAFAGYGLFSVFLTLWWPGARADGGSLLGHSHGASGWNYLLANAFLAAVLIVAVRPCCADVADASQRRRRPVVRVLLGVIATAVLVILLEDYLPDLLRDNATTTLRTVIAAFAALLMATGAAASTLAYLRLKDRLAAYLAISQTVYSVALIAGMLAHQRYTAGWYLGQFMVVGACMVVLAGLLWEYVRLHRREEAQARQLALATEEAQRRAAEFEAVLNSIGDGVAVYGLDGSVLSLNRNGSEILAVSQASLLQPWDERLRELDLRLPSGQPLTPELAPSRRALKGETVKGMLIQARRGDGKPIWLSTTAAPVRDPGGAIISSVLTFSDITPLVAAEEQAQRRAAELDTIIESIADGVMIYDAKGYLLRRNAALQALVQYTDEEILLPLPDRLKLLDLRDPTGRPIDPEEAPAARALRGEIVEGCTLTMYPGTEHEATCLYSGVPLRAPGGEVTGAVLTVSNVTAMKRLQQQTENLADEAQRRAAEFDAIIGGIADAVSINDAEGRLVWCNDLAWKLLRYHGYAQATPEERLSRCRFMRADGTPFAFEDLPLTRALRGEIVAAEIIQMVWPDGESTWVTSSTAPLRDADGNLTGVVLTNTDITPLHRTQDALAESEARYRTVGELLPHGIFALDAQGEQLYTSPAFLDLLGLQPGEITHTVWAGLLHPDDVERALAQRDEGLRSGQYWSCEFRVRGADGQWHWVMARAVPIRNQCGRITSWVGVNIDIDEVKHAHGKVEALLAQMATERERLFSVLDNLPGYVCLIRPDHEFAYVSRRFVDLFGQPAEGQKCHDLNVGLDHPCENCRAFEPLATGRPVTYERHKASGETLEITNAKFVDIDGSIMSLETGVDITARKQTEAELDRHRHHLEELVESRTRVLSAQQERLRALASELVNAEQSERQRLAGLLHDEVAQPLGAMKLHLSMLRTQCPDAADQVTRLLQLTDEATTHTRTIMTQLDPPVLQRMGLIAAMQWWASVVQERHGLRVEVSAPEGRLQLEKTLEIAVFRAVRELIQNVVKHAEADEVQVGFECDDGELSVTVADDGIGFDPQAVKASLKGGFGLLSIQERMAYLGGSVSISSEPGGGCRVTLKLAGLCELRDN